MAQKDVISAIFFVEQCLNDDHDLHGARGRHGGGDGGDDEPFGCGAQHADRVELLACRAVCRHQQRGRRETLTG